MKLTKDDLFRMDRATKIEHRVRPTMQERLQDKIESVTSQELHTVKQRLKEVHEVAAAAAKHGNLLAKQVAAQEATIDYLLEVLLNANIDLPKRVEELIADRIEKKFFGKQGLDEEPPSKYSMFKVADPLEELKQRASGGAQATQATTEEQARAAMAEAKRRALSRAGW